MFFNSPARVVCTEGNNLSTVAILGFQFGFYLAINLASLLGKENNRAREAIEEKIEQLLLLSRSCFLNSCTKK